MWKETQMKKLKEAYVDMKKGHREQGREGGEEHLAHQRNRDQTAHQTGE